MKPLTEQERSAIAAEAKRVAAAVPALGELLGRTIPRLVDELRAAHGEADSLRAALDKEKTAREKEAAGPPSHARVTSPTEQTEAVGALLAAPFRVSARAAAAARAEPLAALAVQVAKALSADASPVERARLIAMAFAASQGDLEAFWAARRQRKLPTPSRSTPLRGK